MDTPRSPEMLDFLLKFDEEEDAEYKEKMIKMLKNKDGDGDQSGINVLETFITRDIGKNKNLLQSKYNKSYLNLRPG